MSTRRRIVFPLHLRVAFAAMVVVVMLAPSRGGGQPLAQTLPWMPAATAATGAVSFSVPEKVTIEGYTGSSEEDSHISPDGKYLFFDSHNDSGRPSILYWATRIDYKTFKFMGEIQIQGVQRGNGQEIVSGMDAENHFYFLLTSHPSAPNWRGTFVNGVVSNASPVLGIAPRSFSPFSPWHFNVRAVSAVGADDATLYFGDSELDVRTRPPTKLSSRISIATKNPDGTYTRLPASDDVMKNVTAVSSFEYGPAISDDGLMLVFNAVQDIQALQSGSSTEAAMYIATRSSVSEPFVNPQPLTAVDTLPGPFNETGNFSHDGKYFYFHRVLDRASSQAYVLTRQ